MSKKNSGLDWLSRELLTSPYCYALCLDEGAFKKELKRLGVPRRLRPSFTSNNHCDATVNFFEETGKTGRCCIVCLKPAKGRAREVVYGVLVHEAVHIWQACREHIGETVTASEQEAYAIQRIAQSLMHSYKEQTQKRKKK